MLELLLLLVRLVTVVQQHPRISNSSRLLGNDDARLGDVAAAISAVVVGVDSCSCWCCCRCCYCWNGVLQQRCCCADVVIMVPVTREGIHQVTQPVKQWVVKCS